LASFSKSQIDRLGDRLKKGSPSDADLRLLDEYRHSFGDGYDVVIRTIREKLHLEPTGRPAKSTSSIAEKLRRESIRLSQVQDIAGCRVIVADVFTQDQTIAMLRDTFPETRVTDRRTNPSHGYRAVHIIVAAYGVSLEIQVRTALQHLWAELSERLADVVDSNIKYGGGTLEDRKWLALISENIAGWEELENQLVSSPDNRAFHDVVANEKKSLVEIIHNHISTLERNRKR
jgi:putative GTP pyrophosphokinase